MPLSNFKERSHKFNSGIGKCPCGQTFTYRSERDMKMKLQMHSTFCSKPPKSFNMTRIPKKATMLKEYNSYEAERMRSVHQPCAPQGP